MESAMYTITWFTWDHPELAAQASDIRKTVFVEEQNVSPEEEYDEYEVSSRHVILQHNGISIGTARWRHTEKGVKLERFAVLSDFRNKGAGSRILNAVLEEVVSLGKKIYLHAQVPAMNLYRKAGFIPQGELFYEADMAHYLMVYSPGAEQ
jgi:predicted GNAT family N-acyltransferase